jgi:hypothetical protein
LPCLIVVNWRMRSVRRSRTVKTLPAAAQCAVNAYQVQSNRATALGKLILLNDKRRLGIVNPVEICRTPFILLAYQIAATLSRPNSFTGQASWPGSWLPPLTFKL